MRPRFAAFSLPPRSRPRQEARAEAVARGEAFIQSLVTQGGPLPSDDRALDAFLLDTYARSVHGQFDAGDLSHLRAAYGEAFSLKTMQGFAFHKPHGYAGDYEIIDRVYRCYMTPCANLANWDRFFHATGGARAVRNRKAYLHALLRTHLATGRRSLRVLNVASGPGRDIYEYFVTYGAAQAHFDCLESDGRAIAYAEELCKDFRGGVSFAQGNALSFRPRQQYDLVWSAGLFDYFSDRLFCRLLRRLLGAVALGGELVIGNFSEANPTRPLMHMLDWELNQRSPAALRRLGAQCGLSPSRLRVGHEPEGINLFLHIASAPT